MLYHFIISTFNPDAAKGSLSLLHAVFPGMKLSSSQGWPTHAAPSTIATAHSLEAGSSTLLPAASWCMGDTTDFLPSLGKKWWRCPSGVSWNLHLPGVIQWALSPHPQQPLGKVDWIPHLVPKIFILPFFLMQKFIHHFIPCGKVPFCSSPQVSF